MRPTREGAISPQRRGLVYSGIGIDPDTVTTDPEPPTDRAALGTAYVPFLVTGAAALVQSGYVAIGGFIDGSVTLTNAPTVGNMLVACLASATDSGPTYSLDNGTWTQVTPDVYSGNGTNLPNRMYYQTVTSSTSATTTFHRSGGTGIGDGKFVLLELSGVDSVDADHGSASNTSSTTDSITPAAGLPAVLVSGTFSRNGSIPSLSPAGSMTELVEVGPSSRPLGVNYQEVASTTGSYTVGSTGAGANASMIGAAFVDTGESVVWIPAPLTVDGDDASYDYAYDTGITEFWRIDLGDTYLIDSITARLAFETAGSNAIILQGANEADYSDAVTIATIPLTATGSFTAQDVSDSWTPTAVYRYWQLAQTTEDDIRIHEVELLTSDTSSGGVSVHGLLSGRDVADQHPADAVTLADVDDWFDDLAVGDVEAAIAVLAAKSIGYEAHGNMGSTETFDAAIGYHSGTLTANCTLTLTPAEPNGTVSSLFLELAQDGTGGWTITLPASVVNKTDLEADQVTTASETTFLALLSRDGGTTWYGGWWLAETADAGRWELAVIPGSPPDPLYADGDYLYIFVPS